MTIQKKRRRSRRRLFAERLEDRRLLVAATDLASIAGDIFVETGGGATPVANVALDLFLDDGDSTFEPNAGSGDNEVRMTMTDSAGRYNFARLPVGNYFVVQPAQTDSQGRSLQRQVSSLIQIDANAVRGRITTSIDTFNQTAQEARDVTVGDGPIVSILATQLGEAIGGERELIVNKTSVDGAVQLRVDNPLLPDQLIFDSEATGQGPRRIVWDGPDNDADVIDDLGLNNADLSADAAGIQLQIRADLAGGNAIVRIYSNDGAGGTASRFSTATLAIPATTGSFLSAEFIPFSDFVAAPGGGADFANVGAIELEITGAADVNGASELVGAVGTTNFEQDFTNTQSADLELTKSVSSSTANVNDEVTFTLSLFNRGPDNATGVQVTDILPTGIDFVSTSDAAAYTPGTGIWNVGSVATGNTETLDIVGRVTSFGNRSNVAAVTAVDQPDPDSSPTIDNLAEDDQDSATVDTIAIDLELSKSVSNATPNVGDTVSFTITVVNNGPNDATGIQVLDQIPAGLTLQTPAPETGNYNTTTGVWTIPNLSNGQTTRLVLPVTVGNASMITNVAQITAASQFDVDSTPGNGTANGEDDFGSVSLMAQSVDLSLAKSLSNTTPPFLGEEIVFNLSLANSGPDAATNVQVHDRLPAGLTFVSSTTTSGSYDGGSGLWNVGTVAVGSTPQLSIRARVDSVDTRTNTAQIESVDQFDVDSTPGNNIESEDDQASALVSPQTVDLELQKSINNSVVDVGDTVRYTVAVTNRGTGTATNVVVEDELPASLTFVSIEPAGANFNATSGLWTVGSLAPGQTRTLVINASVNQPVATTNFAEVFSVDQPDIDSTPNNALVEDDRDSADFTIAMADLSITKVVNNESPDVGQNVVFTITVANAGPNTATGISVRDQLPPQTTFVSANENANGFDQATGIWTINELPSGASRTLTIVATANSTDLATNTAEIIAADQQDPDSTPNNAVAGEDDLATAQLQGQQIDLSLTKMISDSSPNVGQEVTFTVMVRNDGTSNASGVVVTDFLPTGVTLVSSLPSRGSFNTTTGAWTVGILNRGDSETIQLVARVDQVLTNAVNRAEVTSAGQPDVDSTPSNNDANEDDQASVTFSTPVADLSLSKMVSNESPNVGEVVTFTVSVLNEGPDNATGVSVIDLLPDGVQFNSTSLSAGTYSASTGIWDLGTLASGQSATLSINATVLTQGTKVNTARVNASDQADPDSTPGNNVDAEDDQDSASLTPPVIDLSIMKSALPLRPSVGEQVTFTVAVSNAGPSDATGVIVTDRLPTDVTFISSDPSTGNFNFANGQWVVGNLATGSTATIDIVAVVNQFTTITNVAQVTAANEFDFDSTPDNGIENEDDQGSVTLTPASADLSLAKTVSNDMPNLGDDVTFTVTVMNAGPDAASDIVIRDSIPNGMTLRTSMPSAGTYDATSGRWSLPSLANSATATLSLVASVDTQNLKTNTAEIMASSEFDPDSTPGDGTADQDDIASASLTPQLVDLALTKIVDDPRPNVGDSIDYTLTLINTGPSTATGIRVSDQLPDGLSFKNFTASQGSYDAATGLWNVGSVADDAVATLRIGATVGNVRQVTNTAELIAVDQVDVDSTAGNNFASEDDQDNADIQTQVADLSLTKTVDNASPNQTENVTFTLTLTNNGPDDATSVVIRDVLPIGLTFVSANPTTGTYDPVTGLWSLASVPNLTTPTLQLVATAASATTITNTAEIFAVRQFDPDSVPGNTIAGEDDQASAIVTPTVVDIAVAATVDIAEPIEGDVITITFTATNEGNIGATGVVASALVPAGLTILSAFPSDGVYDPATGRWVIGAVTNGASTTLTIAARVSERGQRELPIEIIELDQFDVDSLPANNVEAEDDQQTLIIRAPRLLSKRLFLSRQ